MIKTNKFKKRYKEKGNILLQIIPYTLVVTVFMLSIGWATFSQNLEIDGISATVRIQADIRVTGISVSNDDNFNNNGGISNWEEYNVKHIQTSVKLPNDNSQIKYKVQVTNFGNAEMGILNITGLPEYLEYKIEGYNLKDKICVDNKCKLGIQKDIYIIIRYKKDTVRPDNTDIIINLDFDFRPFHKITYDEYIPDNNYPKEVIDGDTYKMSLVYPYPIGAKPFSTNGNVTYKYDGDTLRVENVTSDLIVKSGYIQSIEDLVSLSSYVNNGNDCSGRTFTLEKDLDFKDSGSYRNSNRTNYENISGNLMNVLSNGTGWIPIGTTDYRFKGIFDGKEKTISNIYVDNKTFAASVGFFGAIEDATIKNLKLQGKMTTEDRANMGSISGRAYGNLLIDNIETRVNVTGFENLGSTGGILGSTNYPANITLKNIKNYGNISYGNQSGGIIGWAESNTVTIEKCHNYGKIILDGTGSGLRAGGLVGASTSLYDINIIIKESSNNESVSSSRIAGGLIGYATPKASNFIIVNSYNSGNIDGTLYAGGIIGLDGNKSNGHAYIYNSANTGDIGGGDYASGIVGYTNHGEITIKNSYNAGQLNSTYNYAICHFNSSSVSSNATFDKIYYPNDQIESNLNQVYGTYTYDQMKLQTFVDKLNEYVTSHQSETILDKEYQLSNWEINGHEYPTPKN